MALLGPEGLKRVASHSWKNTHDLQTRLSEAGLKSVFSGDNFHEFVIDLGQPAAPVLQKMADSGVLGGYALGEKYPGMENYVLVCATETKTEEDLDRYIKTLQASL